MKLRYLFLGLVVLALLLVLFWPGHYLGKEEFLLSLGSSLDDFSVLSAGYSHTFPFQTPTGYDTVCFEGFNVTLLSSGPLESFEVPLLKAAERFCRSNAFQITMTNRGDFVEVQGA